MVWVCLMVLAIVLGSSLELLFLRAPLTVIEGDVLGSGSDFRE